MLIHEAHSLYTYPVTTHEGVCTVKVEVGGVMFAGLHTRYNFLTYHVRSACGMQLYLIPNA